MANQSNEWEVVIEEDARRKLDFISVADKDKLLVCYFQDVKVSILLIVFCFFSLFI